jgi:hypothetical protein
MGNGEMLKELRALADADKIPTQAALRLIMSAQADMYEKLGCLSDVQGDCQDEIVRLRNDKQRTAEDNGRLIAELAEKVDAAVKRIDDLKTPIETVAKNPVVVVGRAIQDHRRWAWSIGAGIFLLLSLWFGSPYLYYLLIVLRVPDEVIGALTPIITQIP